MSEAGKTDSTPPVIGEGRLKAKLIEVDLLQPGIFEKEIEKGSTLR